MVWNDDVCIRRARSVHQLDSDILVSAKLQLYRKFSGCGELNHLALSKALKLKISETLSYQNSRKCNSKYENQTKNVLEDNLQRTVLTIPEVSKEPQEINAVWINVNKCIEVTVM